MRETEGTAEAGKYAFRKVRFSIKEKKNKVQPPL